MGVIVIDPVQAAVFKAREAQQAANAASARGNTAAAALHNHNAADWRRTAIRAQARMEDLMTRRHPEIEAMRNKFYDEDMLEIGKNACEQEFMEIGGDAVIINSRTYATHRARADVRGAEITLDKRGRRFLPRALIAEWVSEGDEPLRLLYVSLHGRNVAKGGGVGEQHRSFEWEEPDIDALPIPIREWVEEHRPHDRSSLVPS